MSKVVLSDAVAQPLAAVSPFVSVVMPVRNEAAFLSLSLDSLLANDYSPEMFEVIVVDGMSSDGSQQIVEAYSRRHPRVKYIQNPGRIVATGLNLAIQAAQGEIIVRADSHTRYEPDYIRQCVALLNETGAANVGGAQRSSGTTFIGSAVALATTSKFGAGNAKFRYSTDEQWVDTVYLGAWRKETLVRLGGFDEGLVVNQDYELNYRIRQAGGRILLSPRIRCEYFVRPSMRSFAKQYFRYGLWKINTLVLHPYSLKWRQLAAPLLTAGILISLLLAATTSPLWLALPIVYGSACVLASWLALDDRRSPLFFVMPLVFVVLHLSWGAGFWCGLVRFGIPGIHRARHATRIHEFAAD